jgi:AraC-like DNA-binding protein
MIVQRCKELIKENYSNSNLDIGKIAAKVHWSTGYLSQIFKQATGTSINNIL